MSFEEWWSSYWEPTEGFASVNLESLARDAWEAAQKQDGDVVGELKTLWSEYPSLRDEFAMAAITGLLANSGGPAQENGLTATGCANSSASDVAAWAYELAGAMMKEREK